MLIDTNAATPEETLNDLLGRSRRRGVPIRRSFLQIEGPPKRPGPLAEFVSGRRATALNLWLLLHAGAAAEPWDVRQPAMSWGRMLEMDHTPATEATISRNWRWLERQRLIRAERDHRVKRIYLLREDGSGEPFTLARGEGRGYFKLPYSYFVDRWYLELSLPAKATLLVCLAQAPTFTLPTEHASGWYGISAATLQRGLDELRKRELLKVWSRAKKAPRTRLGYTCERHYALRGCFARPSRESIDVAPPW